MLSYLQSATLLIAHRGLGHSLADRSPPNTPFASSSRPARGDQAGDLVDHMIEDRLVLEKVKVLEGRMKYQIEKLVGVATEQQTAQNSLSGEGWPRRLLHSPPCVLTQFLVHRPTVIPPEPTKPRRSVWRV